MCLTKSMRRSKKRYFVVCFYIGFLRLTSLLENMKEFAHNWGRLANKRRSILLELLVCHTRRIDVHPSNRNYWLQCWIEKNDRGRVKKEERRGERKRERKKVLSSIWYFFGTNWFIIFSFFNDYFKKNIFTNF